MTFFRKCTVPFLIVILMLSLSVSAFADSSSDVWERTSQLEQKYGIFIEYPFVTNSQGQEVPGITLAQLNTLDKALEYVTPQAVREISAYYQQRNNHRLTFAYGFSSASMIGEDGGITQAGFELESSRIELYIPYGGQSGEMAGDTPVTILHELGHAFQFMCTDRYGYDQLEAQWKSVSSGFSYGNIASYESPDKTAYVSGYAATSFPEDFAETFAYGFVSNRDGMGLKQYLSKDGAVSPVSKKLENVRWLLTQYISDYTAAEANFLRCISASSALSYEGARISGVYLQYIGFSEPRYKPLDTIGELGLSSDLTWVSQAGGWQGKLSNGENVLVFPSGHWGDWAA
ncbi:hypothetical protein U6B65_07815 [Oscillospiraceae bacterium MB08-C2-2]|nr:hypothetical protein U6B65_07815 [Oscillospiraceae bacterium MB08-C2-2]